VAVAVGVGVPVVSPRKDGKHCVLNVPFVAVNVIGTCPTGMSMTKSDPCEHWYCDPGGKPAGTALVPSAGSLPFVQSTPDLINTRPVAVAPTRHPGL
jgi:hypothetical protein